MEKRIITLHVFPFSIFPLKGTCVVDALLGSTLQRLTVLVAMAVVGDNYLIRRDTEGLVEYSLVGYGRV